MSPMLGRLTLVEGLFFFTSRQDNDEPQEHKPWHMAAPILLFRSLGRYPRVYPASYKLVWLTPLVTTTCRWRSDCKHYGGEVREVGFWMPFFMRACWTQTPPFLEYTTSTCFSVSAATALFF